MRLSWILVAALAGLQFGYCVKEADKVGVCCSILESTGLGQRVFYPSSSTYAEREASYWSTGAQLGPSCIVQPSSTEEVSVAVRALVSIPECSFAVRSGGQGQAHSGNNVAEGVTIDLGLLNSVVYHKDNETVSLGPGGRWEDVYRVLDRHGVAVAGGRAAAVGVGGFLIGGGNSFYSARKGWACDTVKRFEVVLANGDVILADGQSNADLFLALKGGAGNFGIVTRFDLEAFPSNPIWGGTIIYPHTVMPQLIDAFAKFANVLDNEKIDDSSTIIFQMYEPSIKDSIIVASLLNVDGTEWDEPHKDFFEIQPRIAETLRLTNITNLTAELVMPPLYEDVWGSLTFKNDPRIIAKAVELHDNVVAELQVLSKSGNFRTINMFQPLSVSFGQMGKGRNVLGLESLTEPHVLWLPAVHVCSREEPELSDIAHKLVRDWIGNVEEYARNLGSDGEFVYLNYANTKTSKDPLVGYGGNNAALIAAAARKYDPEGVFQTRVSGGFKISRSFPELYAQAEPGHPNRRYSHDEL